MRKPKQRRSRTNISRTQSLLTFFLFSFLGWVRLSPLGTSITNWPILPATDDKRWVWSSRWNENWQEKPKYSEKTCPIATLSTNPTWLDQGSNPGRRGGKPETNRLSYGTVWYGLVDTEKGSAFCAARACSQWRHLELALPKLFLHSDCL
jgi:hypothetical protein